MGREYTISPVVTLDFHLEGWKGTHRSSEDFEAPIFSLPTWSPLSQRQTKLVKSRIHDPKPAHPSWKREVLEISCQERAFDEVYKIFIIYRNAVSTFHY